LYWILSAGKWFPVNEKSVRGRKTAKNYKFVFTIIQLYMNSTSCSY